MDSIKCNTNKIIKYVMITVIVYTILKNIPMRPMNDRDIILLSAVILISIIVIDNFKLNERFADTPAQDTPAQDTTSTSAQNASSTAATTTSTSAATNTSSVSTTNTGTVVMDPIPTNINEQIPTGLEDLIPEQLPPSDRPMPSSFQPMPPPTIPTPTTSCDAELDKIKQDFEKQINDLKKELTVKSLAEGQNVSGKYFTYLTNELLEKGIIDSNDLKNINTKLASKLLTMDEVITSLEQLKKEGVSKSKGRMNDFAYSELPSEFYSPIGDKIANQWDNDYNILDTNRWQVPMQRPPVCINSEPCKICPLESAPGTTSLKNWDTSRKVTDIKINKKWAANQSSA